MTDQITLSADVAKINRIDIVPRLLEIICRTTGMGFAAVARVTDERWIACGVRDEILFGLAPGGELMLETTICHDIRKTKEAVAIDHVDKDEYYSKHHTPAQYGFQSYISVPIIRKDGSFFGTLCAIDPKPARVNNPETIGMFTMYADLLAFHLNAVEELLLTESKLEEELKTADLREQFIAILGHDLRNPVAAISNSAQLLLLMEPAESQMRIINVIKNSSYRITGLIENMLDFARGRMGGGLSANMEINDDPARLFIQVITELKTIWPERVILTNLDLPASITFDSSRIAQLFSNLLGNALSYGTANLPINVDVRVEDDHLVLTVANPGKKIPDEVIEHLFQPFSRGDVQPGQQGLGLGLYIASEIARAHNGKLSVSSGEKATVFRFDMPLDHTK